MVTTLNDVWLDVKRRLHKGGVDNSSLEARELVCFATGIARERFYDKRSDYIFDKDISEINRLTELRLSGYPMQYIVGQWEFYGLTFDLSTETLIPRPETETLVEQAVAFLGERERGRILELGCGTGCVITSILHSVPSGFTAIAADIEPAALALTRKNLIRHGLNSRVITEKYDMRDPLPETFGKFNIIVSNPPYIRTGELDGLQKEVQYEPRMALDGGEDGLTYYRAIATNCRASLAKNGCIMVEIGYDQAESVKQIFRAAGFNNTIVKKDLSANDRVLIASF